MPSSGRKHVMTKEMEALENQLLYYEGFNLEPKFEESIEKESAEIESTEEELVEIESTDKERSVIESADKELSDIENQLPYYQEASQDAFIHGPNLPELIKDECLFELFEASAKRFPDNNAIIFGEESITYSNLNKMANRLGSMLRSKGVRADDRVAVFMPKCIMCYAAILGTMKAGACYIPLDPGYPEDRVRYIVEDSGAKYILVIEGMETGISLENSIVVSDSLIKDYPDQDLLKEETGVTRNSLAYIIYTSGSTGRPKGVMIEHKAACNLVRASQEIYKATPDDKVYQGFTLAFDASVEELWLAFFNGATLIPQTDHMKKAGPDLFKILRKYELSIISCVPTLLSMIDDDIPTLRLLILGGEACPESVVTRFKKPGRRILNTYGPTEATVIATWSEMKPGEKVTIGKPLPNYSIYVVKENNELAKIGEPGELLIGGIGLARGYIGRDDLNVEKFIKNTFHPENDYLDRLYRSGDLVSLDSAGNIEFLGRIDDQVKIRGYRVELSEIENVANSYEEIKSSVVKVNKFQDSSEALCLYVVPQNKEKEFDTEKLFALLKERLASYMIPPHFMILDEIPMLPSGKADRKQLPLPDGNNMLSNREIIEATDKEEKIISDIIKQVFKIENVSIKDHFFNDLGGHSLYAAQVVSSLRKENGFQTLTISDLYESPTVELLAAKFRGSSKSKVTASLKERMNSKDFNKTSSKAHKICGFFQGLSIFLITLLVCIPIGYVVYNIFSGNFKVKETIISLLLIGLLYNPVTLALSILSKWVLIGKFKEGKYPLWSTYYFRWWLARLFQRMCPEHLLSGTPLMPLYLRLMGAKVDSNCYIGSHEFGAFDLVSIGKNTSIAQDSQLLGYSVYDGYIHFGRITIGDDCYIGTHSSMSINSTMKTGSMIKEQSMVASGQTIPEGEFWAGSPAKKDSFDSDLYRLTKQPGNVSKSTKALYAFIHLIVLEFFGLLSVLMFSQGFIFGAFLRRIPAWVLLVSPITASLIVLMTVLEIIFLKKLFMNKIKPGVYSIYSIHHVRKWIADNIVYLSLQLLHTLYATLYTVPFLRALGAKIGKGVEVSTVTHISPELFEVGDGSFFADASMAGTPKVYNNNIIYEKIKVGSRTFIGNSALVPINKSIGDDCLIGVMSVPPSSEKTENGTSWLGTPAMFLHKRDINNDFSSEETYKPTKRLYLKRLIIEFIRVILPTNIYVLASYALANIFHDICINFFFWPSVLLMALTLTAFEGLLILFVVLLKFYLVGTYKPSVNPLWSSYVWKTEFVTGIYDSMLGDHILTPLTGTPMLPVIMRLLGCRIGKKVFLDTIFISEFDLVKIGREASVNYNSTMQTHLFEDRVLKMDYLVIGNMSSVGNGSVVLYDTFIEEGASLGNSSLLMKGETLEAYTTWHGNPSSMAS